MSGQRKPYANDNYNENDDSGNEKNYFFSKNYIVHTNYDDNYDYQGGNYELTS